ncbi:hypothetical protein [Rhodoferax sp.]|uniref:hypothetical protein n=1 Tax=Rhodoferax sp. TaxID=50421 RepID=UPI003525C170
MTQSPHPCRHDQDVGQDGVLRQVARFGVVDGDGGFFFCSSINAMGLPTMLLAPTMPPFYPATSMLVVSSSSCTP